MPTIRVIAVQPALRWQQAMPNMHLLRQLLDKHLSVAPADLIVLPEVFNGVNSEFDPQAGTVAVKFLSTLARASHAAVVGSVDLACDDGQRRNACLVVGPDGQELGRYYKRVMFGREIGTRTPGREIGIFNVPLVSPREPSRQPVESSGGRNEEPQGMRPPLNKGGHGGVANAEAAPLAIDLAKVTTLRLGVLICGDMWDARLVAELRDRIDILCVPTKTTVPDAGHMDYARRLWWNLALTRAMENAIPIVVSDWAEGRHESYALIDGTRVQSVHYTSGATSITDPGRRPSFDALQQTIPRGQAGLLSASIDLDAVARFRDYRKSVGLLSETNE